MSNYKEEEDFKKGMENSRKTGEPYYTAYQKQFLQETPDGYLHHEIPKSHNMARTADIILSINRPSRFKIFFKSVVRFFRKIFGLKVDDGIYKMHILKNRRGSGGINVQIGFNNKQINNFNK